jgi:DNA-binding CsgD family transcriptional regulator
VGLRYGYKRIAVALEISPWTARDQVKSALRKIDAAMGREGVTA